MKSVNRGFIIGSIISVIGFIALGWVYLHFDNAYLERYPQAIAGFPGHTAENVTAGSARLGDAQQAGPRYASGLDLPDRHHPGRGAE